MYLNNSSLPRSELKVQECDATMLNSSNKVWYKNIFIPFRAGALKNQIAFVLYMLIG